jgi:hypothetical protein
VAAVAVGAALCVLVFECIYTTPCCIRGRAVPCWAVLGVAVCCVLRRISWLLPSRSGLCKQGGQASLGRRLHASHQAPGVPAFGEPPVCLPACLSACLPAGSHQDDVHPGQDCREAGCRCDHAGQNCGAGWTHGEAAGTAPGTDLVPPLVPLLEPHLAPHCRGGVASKAIWLPG